MAAIILASASPRRAELLDQIGISYHIQVVDIDESRHKNETAEELVLRLAKEKSQVIINSHIPVLGSDTLGLFAGEILVKPRDFDHAYHMLSQMSGNWHEILTAVAVTFNNETKVRLTKNRVLFRQLSLEEITLYWQTGEPTDKAGAYAIQGIAASFIEKIEGSYSGIMGLPLFETSQLLNEFGVSVIGSNQQKKS